MLSAFGIEVGEVSKTDLGGGRYAPATSLSANQHRQASSSRYEDRFKARHNAQDGRALDHVYDKHAIGPAIRGAVKSPTRPSKVHPNIQYGNTVSSQLEHHLDRALDPRAAKALKHPVVYHHAQLGHGVIAGAAGAHQTTGGKGHVVVNTAHVDQHGKVNVGATSFKATMNHELAHASRRGINPVGIAQRGPKAWTGEEARADAHGVPGKGAYRRNGVIGGRGKVTVAERATRGHEALSGLNENLKTAQYYHRIHGQVRSAVPKPKGLLREAAHELAAKPQRAVVPVLAGALVVRHEHQKRQRMGKSAFGVDHEQVAKAYTPGSITVHQARSDIARRKKQSANRVVRAGLATASVGGTAAALSANNSHDVARAIGRPAAAKAIRVKGTRAGVAAAAAGGAIAGVGAAVRAKHAHVQNREAKLANHYREQRLHSRQQLEKSAFGVVHKGALAALDDTAAVGATVAGKAKGPKQGTLTPAVPPAGTVKPKVSVGQKLNNAVSATGGSPN